MAFGIAVLGLDHWYTAFGVLDICYASKETPLVSVYEKDAARRAQVAEAYPNIIVSGDLEEVLSPTNIRLAAICAKTGDAVKLVQEAVINGRHAVTVKPFARSRAEMDKQIEQATSANRFLGSFEGMQRLHGRAEKLRELIQSGAIGDVVAFHQVGHGPLPAPWRDAASGEPSWWLDPAQVPGGAWIDHAIYAVDLARFVLGGEIISVTGTLDNRLHKNLPVEDYGAALMTLRRPDGSEATLSITDTWCAEPGNRYGEYRFLGTRGTITGEGYNTWIVQNKEGTTRHEIEKQPFFRFDKLAGYLEHGLMVGQEPPFGANDARANMGACFELYGR